MEVPYINELNTRGNALGFRNRRLEAEFRAYAANRDRVQLRLQLSLAMLLVCLVTVMDHIFRDVEFAQVANAMRGLVMLPPLFVMFALTFLPRWNVLLQPAGVVVGLAVGMAMLIIGTLDPGSAPSPMLPGYVLLTIFVYFFLGLRFPVALGTAVTLLAAFIAAKYLHGIDGVTLAYGIVYLLFLNIASSLGAYQVQKVARLRFLEERILSYRANHDAVTRLPNRRAFDEYLAMTWDNAKFACCPIAVMMVDIDHFKKYNDLYGHQAGDYALREVAQVIETSLRRPQDFAGRYGGEEFVVLLYDSSPEFAENYAESLRRQIVDERIEHRTTDTGDYVSISVGIAHLEPATTERSMQGFVQMADEALYAAKKAGRNRVMSSDRAAAAGLTGLFKVLQADDESLLSAMADESLRNAYGSPRTNP